MKKLLIAITAAACLVGTAEAKPYEVDPNHRLWIGDACADATEDYVANMLMVYKKEDAYRPFEKIPDLKKASAPGMRSRVAMKKSCMPQYIERFDQRMIKEARKEGNDWFVQLKVWYMSQPQLVEQGLVAPYF